MIIEALIAVCLAGAIAVFLAPDEFAGQLSFLVSLVPLFGSFWLFFQFEGTGNALFAAGNRLFETQLQLISLGTYDVHWHVGIDGISLPLIIMTTILITASIVSAWHPIDKRQSEFYGLILLTEASLIGVFAILDFFVWFLFWEAALVPMFLLIGVWGGPRRKYAAMKMLLYTNLASLVMFLGFIGLLVGLPVESFSLIEVTEALHAGELTGRFGLSAGMLATVAFFAMFVGFATKIPMVPLHTWLPDAHVQAPSPVSVILAGALLKMGTYAMLRFNFTMLPEVARANAELIALIAVISMVYGAIVGMAQDDLKRIIAYLSIASMGYVVLGLVAFTVLGMGGATFQMVSHGFLSGMLFMGVGVIYHTTHTRQLADLSGLLKRLPVAVGLFLLGTFGYMGMPLLSGFPAEVFIFVGVFGADVLAWSMIFTGIGIAGYVIVTRYLLYEMQHTLVGPVALADVSLDRTTIEEAAPLVFLFVFIVILGVFPDAIFDMIQNATEPLIAGGEH